MAILGKDSDGRPLNTMAGVSLARTYSATISGSTQVTFNASTTIIVVTALDKSVFLRWGTSAASNANFDIIIPAGESRILRVPPTITAANVIEQSATAAVAVVEF